MIDVKNFKLPSKREFRANVIDYVEWYFNDVSGGSDISIYGKAFCPHVDISLEENSLRLSFQVDMRLQTTEWGRDLLNSNFNELSPEEKLAVIHEIEENNLIVLDKLSRDRPIIKPLKDLCSVLKCHDNNSLYRRDLEDPFIGDPIDYRIEYGSEYKGDKNGELFVVLDFDLLGLSDNLRKDIPPLGLKQLDMLKKSIRRSDSIRDFHMSLIQGHV